MKVYKYPLEFERLKKVEITVEMPKDARILCTNLQNKTVCIWVLCDPEADTEIRAFQLYATGETVLPKSAYVGTVFFPNATFVFHLFESKS